MEGRRKGELGLWEHAATTAAVAFTSTTNCTDWAPSRIHKVTSYNMEGCLKIMLGSTLTLIAKCTSAQPISLICVFRICFLCLFVSLSLPLPMPASNSPIHRSVRDYSGTQGFLQFSSERVCRGKIGSHMLREWRGHTDWNQVAQRLPADCSDGRGSNGQASEYHPWWLRLSTPDKSFICFWLGRLYLLSNQ